MITLQNGATTVYLPELTWVDEHSWMAVQQAKQYTITGAMILESAAKQAGRTIMLQGGDTYGWVSREDLATLKSWALLAGTTFTLVLLGDTYTVVFDHETTAIDARAVVDYSDPVAGDFYVLTMRFIEV